MRLTEEQRELVEKNRGLAVSVAKRYARVWPYEYDDILGAAFIGLCFAAAYFKPEMGWQFSTYATWTIKRNAWRSLVRSQLINVPSHHFTNAEETAGTREKFAAQVQAAMRGTSSLGSIDIREDTQSHVDEILDREDNETKLRWLKRRIRQIPKRDKQIFMRRVRGETLVNIAADFGVTKERVRQICSAVQADIRKSAERKFA